jgi:Cu(I)/Ag(I) efflux system membrane protein CusA/SilA
MVDAAIVVVENAYKSIAEPYVEGDKGQDNKSAVLQSLKEVGPSAFFSLLVIAVAFFPIFALEAYEGKMFKPLAYTKNLAMLFAACLAVTLVVALRMLFTRSRPFAFKPVWLSRRSFALLIGTYYPEHRHPISRGLFFLYEPAIRSVLRRPKAAILAAILVFSVSMPLFLKIGREFMPPLNEGSLLYMPTTPPGISIGEAGSLLQVQDRILRGFPEVERVFGKAGRALTSTDPAPLSMMETTVLLRPQNEWGKKPRWYSGHVPEFLQGPLRILWPDRISYDELIAKMEAALKLPGQVNSWTMPVKGRIDMLTTGIRTPVGIKILGDDLREIERIGENIESLLNRIKGTRSVYAERTAGGYYLDIRPRRDEIARYGLSVQGLQETLVDSIGGANVSETVEGRERYPINVRFPRERRDDIESLRGLYVSTPTGTYVPLGQLAQISLKTGPGMIRDENGRLAGYVFVDIQGVDIGSYVNAAKDLLRKELQTPPGYTLSFSGQYESMQRVERRMRFVVPLTLFIIFLLLYLNTRSYTKTLIVLLAVPFSLIGVAWALWLLGYNFSLGVMAGIIALLGVDAETGVFMLLYLDLAYERRLESGKMQTLTDLREAIHEGALGRLRPKIMTVMTAFIGLLPIMWAQTHEIGADVMKRIAAPMVGGIFSSFLMELLVYPAIYFLWRRKSLNKP